MRKLWQIVLMLVATTGLLAATSLTAAAADAPRMTTEELKARLGTPGLVILDARGVWDWVKSGDKIRGAVRIAPNKVRAWAGDYAKDQSIVLYCA